MSEEVQKRYTIDEFIGIYDNFFDESYIDAVIDFFEKCDRDGMAQPSSDDKLDRDMDEVFFNDPALVQRMPDNFAGYFYKVLWDEMYPLYVDKFNILKRPRMTAMLVKMKRIKPSGGFHSWHCEGFEPVPQRQLVVQLYLNDVDEGGETEFLYQSKRIKPKRNRALIWPADWTYTHRGNPPLGKQVKYILTTWLTEVPN
jgi:hypothetical protein